MLRVITQKQRTTQIKEIAEEDVNINLMAVRGLQQQANFAHKARYMDSADYGNKWGDYLENNLAQKPKQSKESVEVVNKFKKMNKQVQSAVSNRIQREVLKEEKIEKMDKMAEKPKQEKKGFFSRIFGKSDDKKIKEVAQEDQIDFDEDAECEAIHNIKNINSDFK